MKTIRLLYNAIVFLIILIYFYVVYEISISNYGKFVKEKELFIKKKISYDDFRIYYILKQIKQCLNLSILHIGIIIYSILLKINNKLLSTIICFIICFIVCCAISQIIHNYIISFMYNIDNIHLKSLFILLISISWTFSIFNFIKSHSLRWIFNVSIECFSYLYFINYMLP